MKITLTPELEAFIKRKMESGKYHSPSEIVHEALYSLEDFDHLLFARLDFVRKMIARIDDSQAS